MFNNQHTPPIIAPYGLKFHSNAADYSADSCQTLLCDIFKERGGYCALQEDTREVWV